jgi:hypothetical protein
MGLFAMLVRRVDRLQRPWYGGGMFLFWRSEGGDAVSATVAEDGLQLESGTDANASGAVGARPQTRIIGGQTPCRQEEVVSLRHLARIRDLHPKEVYCMQETKTSDPRAKFEISVLLGFLTYELSKQSKWTS